MKYNHLLIWAILSTGCGGIGAEMRAGVVRTARFDSRPPITDTGPPPTETRSQVGAGFHFRSGLPWLGGVAGVRAFGDDLFPEVGPVFRLNHAQLALTALPDVGPTFGPALLQAEATYLFGESIGWEWGVGVNYGVTTFLEDRERRLWILGASLVVGYWTEPF